MADRQLKVEFSVDTKNSAQDLEKVRDAAVKFGKDGEQNANALVRALENVGKAEDAVALKIAQGRTVTEKDGSRMIQVFSVLETQIKETFGSLAKAPVEIQQAFAKAEAAANKTKTVVRSLSDEVADQKSQLKEGGEQWDGLGNAMNRAAGPMGGTVARIGLIAAAFKEGWSIGMQLNKFFGTDMQAWEDATKELGSRMLAIVQALGTNIKATFLPVWDVLHGNFKQAATDFGNIAQVSADSNRTMTNAVSMTNEEWAKYAKTLGITTNTAREAAEADAKLAEEKAKLRDEINKVTASLKAETAELEKQKGVAREAEAGTIEGAAQARYYGREVERAAAALAAQRDEVEKLTAAHGASDPVTQEAITKQQQLEQQLAHAQARYSETSAQVKQYEQAQKDAERAIDQHAKQIEKLNAERTKETAQLAQAGGATAQQTTVTQQATATTQAAATATDQHAQSTGKATTAVVMYKDAQGKVHIETKKVADTTAEATKATDNITTSMTKAAPVMEKTATAIGKISEAFSTQAVTSTKSLTEAVDKLGDGLERVVKIVGDLTTAMKELDAASNTAAGAMESVANAGMD